MGLQDLRGPVNWGLCLLQEDLRWIHSLRMGQQYRYSAQRTAVFPSVLFLGPDPDF